jgi:hypothetical protein
MSALIMTRLWRDNHPVAATAEMAILIVAGFPS